MAEMCPNVLHFEDNLISFGYASKQAPFGHLQDPRALQATNDIGNMSVSFYYGLNNNPLMIVFQVLVEIMCQL